MQNVLEQIAEGMEVYDRAEKRIGKVEYVKLVDVDAATGEPEAADVDHLDDRRTTLINSLAEAFSGDDLPEVIRQRLLHDGFVRMDADGLFAADRYLLPDQIAAVTGDRVILNVEKDELVKRH